MVGYIAIKLTRNGIIALELIKNMDIDKALRLAFGFELIQLCTIEFEKYEIAWRYFKGP